MKKLYYPILFLAFVATDCFGTKKSTKSSKTNKLNPSKASSLNREKEVKSDPVKAKKKDDNSNKSDLGNTDLCRSVSGENVNELCRLLSLGVDPNISGLFGTPLEEAVRKRNKKMVSMLLSHGAKITFDKKGKSRVLNAVRNQKDNISKEIYELLKSKLSSEELDKFYLDGRKDINDIDSRGETILAIAVRENDTEQVKKLLKKGANPNIHSEHSDLLYSAVYNQNKEIVSLLLSHGAEVLFDNNGRSSVIAHVAGTVGTNQEILDMILCHFADMGKKDSVGLSPIHWACRDGHISVVKHILSKDRSVVNNTDNLYKFTPLHWSARRGFKEIVELLVANGASKTARSRSGFTPLMLAISNKHASLRDILSPDGFERQSKLLHADWMCSICLEGLNDSRDKIFPLIPLECGHKFHFRCISSNVTEQVRHNQPTTCPNCRSELSEDMVQKIVDNALFPTVSAFSTLGAAKKQDMTRLKYLLEKGGNPNESSIANHTLQVAVNGHNYEMVTLLLDYGADPTYQDPGSNSTPLHEAVENMLFKRTSEEISNKICIALIQHGALVNVRRLDRNSGSSPKDVYCTNDDPLFVIVEAGGIRSGWTTEINPAFGLSGDKMEYKILFPDN